MSASELIMPTLPDQQPHQFSPPRLQHHNRSQSYQPPPTSDSYTQASPLSTSGSTGASPTSPKSYHARGPRAQYIPAVLRPTEFPSKPSRCSNTGAISANGSLRRSSGSFMSLAGLSIPRLVRRSTGDSGKCVDGELDVEAFPRVTSLPTRKHWKPDPSSTICDDPTCKKTFSYFTRRHHCRRCGNIFCDSHSRHAIPLDQEANYNPRGTPSRSCGHCFSQFQAWKSLNNSQASSSTASWDGNHNMLPTSPIPTSPAVPGVTGPAKGVEVAASVPRDWNWSTF